MPAIKLWKQLLIFSSLALLLAGAGPLSAQSLVNDFPCGALSSVGSPGTVTTITGNSAAATADTFMVAPDCGGLDNSIYYRYQLPAGYTNARVTLQPSDSSNLSVMLFRSGACAPPVPVSGSLVCTDNPGDTIATGNPGCFAPGANFLIRVAGDPAAFKIRIFPIEPSCTDSCLNGSEIAVDSIAAPVVTSSTGVFAACADDSIMLTASGDTASWTSVVWSTGDSSLSTIINSIGIYSVTVTTEFGCSATTTVLMRADTTCVWPGETNLDGVVDLRDIIPIGFAYGQTGPPRPSPLPLFPPFSSVDLFPGEPSLVWVDTVTMAPVNLPGVYDNVNLRHVDANGDGIIDDGDITPVLDNYGRNVYYRMGGEESGSLTAPPFFLTFDKDSAEVGDTLRTFIHLGSAALPADSVLSFRFLLNFDPYLIDTGFFELSFDTSWLRIDSLGTDIGVYYKQPGFVDVAFSRTDGIVQAGFGPIASMDIIIIDDLAGRLSKQAWIDFSFSGEELWGPNLIPLEVTSYDTTFLVTQFCDSEGLDASGNWIEGVRFKSKTFITGSDGGYMDTVITLGQLFPGLTLPVYGAPGFPTGGGKLLHWKAYADFNLDGDFDDAGETWLDQYSDSYVGAPLVVPGDAAIGWTTIRFQAADGGNDTLQPCSDVPEGEVEDYRIEIRGTFRAQDWDEPLKIQIMPNPATGSEVQLYLQSTEPLEEVIVWLRDPRGTPLLRRTFYSGQDQFFRHSLSLEDLPAGFYFVEVESAAGRTSGKLLVVH